MPPSFPSGTNTFIPNTAASNNLLVDFSRNPNDFPLAKWTQYVPTKQRQGRYINMTVEQAGRILNNDAAEFAWADGADAPQNEGRTESFEFLPFYAERFAPGFRIGEHSAAQAEWDILAQHSRIQAQVSMTLRTMMSVTQAVDTNNYPTGHNSDVTAIPGTQGRWDESTVARQDIKRSLDYAYDIIRLSTLGAVKPEQVMLVMSPGCARKIAVTQEIKDYLKGSPSAEKDLKEGLGKNVAYGLPDTYSGYPLVVEDAVRVTSRKGATKTAADVLADDTPFMCSRPGELEGVEGTPSFSTHTQFLYEEMIVETKHDRDNKVHVGRVINTFDAKVTAGISGFLFTNAVS